MSGWSSAVRRAVAAAALFACVLLVRAAACADPTLIDVSDQPIILIQHNQPVQIRTWDRQQISVDVASGEPPQVERRVLRRAAGDATYPVPIPAVSLPAGPDGGPAIQLGPEEFPVTTPPGAHDTVRVQLPAGAATVTIPSNTSILSVNGTGATGIRDYHGQLVAQQRFGPLVLRNIGGVAFVQNLRGAVYVSDSTFDRLRTRTGMQNMVFERCNVKQIEASSVRGSITFDDGTFQPGLARFETTTGHVALGINGNANIGVKGSPGQIYQNFDRAATFNDRNGEATASLGTGGPLVNIVTQQGKVFLYDGSIAGKRALPAPWAPVREPFTRFQRQFPRQPPLVAPPDTSIPAFHGR